MIKDIRRATRRHFSSEDKIRIVLEGLRGEDSIAELCRRESMICPHGSGPPFGMAFKPVELTRFVVHGLCKFSGC